MLLLWRSKRGNHHNAPVRSTALLNVLFWQWICSTGCHAFLPQPKGTMMAPPKTTNGSRRFVVSTEDVESMKRDIEEMRKEAMDRLDALNERMKEVSAMAKDNDAKHASSSVEVHHSHSKQHTPSTKWITSSPSTLQAEMMEERAEEEARMLRRFEESDVASQHNVVTTLSPVGSNEANRERDLHLLDDTRWRIVLNVGREPGTWMPKTWGASGERLLLNLVVDFSSDQLYEREEFLGGTLAGAKVLYVVDNRVTVGPTMTEGSRSVKAWAGGWKIAEGGGPAGTDVLRFFVEIEEDIQHHDSDVYCPAGRLYCTCGYFPLTNRNKKGTSLKEVLTDEQIALGRKYEQLSQEMDDDTSLVSWQKIKRAKELFDLRVKAGALTDKINEAKMKEPEKSTLRLSEKRDVGLTREGGVCCKVSKGLATEYHILGRFAAASEKKRDKSELHP